MKATTVFFVVIFHFLGLFPFKRNSSENQLSKKSKCLIYESTNGDTYCLNPDNTLPALFVHIQNENNSVGVDSVDAISKIFADKQTTNQTSEVLPYIYKKEKSAKKKAKRRKTKRTTQPYRDLLPDFDTAHRNIKLVDLENISDSVANKFPSQILQEAQKYLGVRYRFGGVTPRAFDCSGFVHYSFTSLGLNLPRSSHQQSMLGTTVSIDEARAGDLIFFGRKRGQTYATTHVGIVVEAVGGKLTVLHSARRNGVVIEKDLLNISYYKKRFLFIKRVV